MFQDRKPLAGFKTPGAQAITCEIYRQYAKDLKQGKIEDKLFAARLSGHLRGCAKCQALDTPATGSA